MTMNHKREYEVAMDVLADIYRRAKSEKLKSSVADVAQAVQRMQAEHDSNTQDLLSRIAELESEQRALDDAVYLQMFDDYEEAS